jgi:putative ABC transport system ATP-binding protein
MGADALVRVENVSKDYRLGAATVKALVDVTLDIMKGDFLVIAGPSGSGKTTLLNLIGLLDTPASGEIWLDGENVTRRSLQSLHRHRRDRMGYIFQTFNLIPVLSVYENVEYPLILRGIPAAARRKLVEDALERVGLLGRKRHRPRELSGGERQRVSIARAIVKSPRIVLADEPTANLDSTTGGAVLGVMEELNRADSVTFVFSSHDARVIERGSKVVRMRDGAIGD